MQQFFLELRLAPVTSLFILLILTVSISGFFKDLIIFRLGYCPKDIQLHGRVWQIFSYPFVHLNIPVMLVNLVFLWFFGFTLESYFSFYTHFWGHLYLGIFYVVTIFVSQIPTYFTRMETPKFQVIGTETLVAGTVCAATLMDPSMKCHFYVLEEGIPLILFSIAYYIYCFFISRYYNKFKQDWGWAYSIPIAIIFVWILYPFKFQEILFWLNR